MMDRTEGDSRYLPNYGVSHGYGLGRPEVSARNLPQPHSHLTADNYVDEDDEVEEEDEDEEEADAGDGGVNGSMQQNGDYVDNDVARDGFDSDNNDDDGGDDDDDDHDDYDDDDGGGGGEDYKRTDGFKLHRHPKKRKLKSLLSSFELAPRVPPLPQPPPAAKSGGRNTLTDWTEHETFVLLDSWGERFLQRGRKSLRSEEWQEVSEKVSQESKIERTDTQCRNRLDTLKKKYKKEKALLEHNKSAYTKWVYFKKMDMLIAAKPPQQSGVSCGVDSGEFVFMNPSAYLNRANGLDEMRDSLGNTGSQDDDFDLLPPKKLKLKGEKVSGGSFKLLADSINKFSEIYEKIEDDKRKQMVELEKMRMDFHKDLELQKKQIIDRARDEIAKIRQGDYEENDDSAENIRG